jgi:DNA-binding transcriptional LysR family regulator
MDLSQIAVFKAIVEEGSLRKAAQTLAKTQPALSVSLKNLELELGFELFDRSQYRLKLSPRGQRFWEGVQNFSLAEIQLKELAAELKDNPETRLDISLDSAAPFSDVIPILQSTQKQFPALRLNLIFGVLNQSTEALLSNEVELAISPIFKPSNMWDSHFLFNQNLIPCIHKKHVKGGKIAASSLREIPNIVVSTKKDELPFTVGSIRGAHGFHVSNNAVKEQLICEGFGWGRIPENRLKDRNIQSKLHIIKLRELSDVQLQFHIIWNNDHALSAPAKAVRELLIDHYQKTE